jgi:hypothetical protein
VKKSILTLLLLISLSVAIGMIGVWVWQEYLQPPAQVEFLNTSGASSVVPDPNAVDALEASLRARLPVDLGGGRIVYDYGKHRFTVIGCASEEELKDFLRAEQFEGIPIESFVFELSETCQ